MKHAVDCSNYSAAITVEQFIDLRDNYDCGAVIVQAVDPPAQYPPTVTQQQIEAAFEAGGIAVHAYIFWWFQTGIEFLQRQLALLEPYAGRLHRVWLDIEDTTGGPARSTDGPITPPLGAQARLIQQPPPPPSMQARRPGVSAEARIADVQSWLNVLDQYPTLLGETGIYGAAWHWDPYMGGTTVFAEQGRKIWAADYNGEEDLTTWDNFGGWSGEAALHQYAGTSTLAGVQQIDLNVIAESEMTVAEDRECDWGWQDKKELVVTAAGELLAVADQLDAEAARIQQLANDVRLRAQKILE